LDDLSWTSDMPGNVVDPAVRRHLRAASAALAACACACGGPRPRISVRRLPAGPAACQAPGVPALPLARLTTDAALIASLQARFAIELPVLAGEITEAARAGNWFRLQDRAHYLKNSADLVGARGLGAVCQAVLATTAPPGPAEVQTLAAGIVAASRHPFAPAPSPFATPAINENQTAQRPPDYESTQSNQRQGDPHGRRI